MAETPDTADEIKTIRYKIESIETTQHLLLRNQRKELLDDLLKVFAKSPNLIDVYLSIDGKRGVTELVSALKSATPPISQPTVYRKIKELDEEESLIQKCGVAPGGAIIWGKKEVVEKVLRLSPALLRYKKKKKR